MNPLAVVTGASSGIGRELARVFKRNGFDLVVAAEDEGIQAVADELGAQPVRVDLATPDGVEGLYAALPRPVDALALNAGIVVGGQAFTDTDVHAHLRLVDLDVRSVVHLARLVGADMAARGSGRMLLTSSIVATMPGPYQTTYNASKSFVQSFGLSLRDELADDGVSVTLLMPGPTETNIFARAGMLDTLLGGSEHKDDPADVAQQAFDALMAGRERVVTASLVMKAASAGSRLLPDSVKARISRVLSEPR